MRRKIVAGNWKMNGGLAFSAAYLAQFKKLASTISDEVDVVIAPAAVLIPAMVHELAGTRISIAGQNVAAFERGAFTGEISAAMLAETGCQWCLVGHSERRQLFGESDATVSEKVLRLLESDIRPVLCVGETLAQREAGQALDTIRHQVESVLASLNQDQLLKLVIAYEPVWAIGTGMNATPEQAQEVHRFIRSLIADMSASSARVIPLIYGGSVNQSNAKGLFEMSDIDGALIGGASLKADEFAQICALAG
jgi:triosephosphate isomerase